MSPLRPLDYFQIATTGLLVLLGAIILVRSHALAAAAPGYLIGLGFLGYGLYRARFIVRALRRPGKAP